MIIQEKGDLLKSDVQIKVHQTNCYGAMGAGIAKQIKDIYPEVFKQYKECCNKRTPEELFGGIQILKTHKGDYICNLFGQKGYGRGKIQTDYKKFEQGLYLLKKYIEENNQKEGCEEITSIGFPKLIGCGLAGGDWEIVSNLIRKYFGETSSIICKIIDFE